MCCSIYLSFFIVDFGFCENIIFGNSFCLCLSFFFFFVFLKMLCRILRIFVRIFAHLRILADFQPTSSESRFIPLKCAGMWKQVFCSLRASRASLMLFSLWRAGAGLPVCIVSEALWAQQGAYDRVPASLQGFIAAVSEGLWEIESLCLYYKLKPHSIVAFRKKKIECV